MSGRLLWTASRETDVKLHTIGKTGATARCRRCHPGIEMDGAAGRKVAEEIVEGGQGWEWVDACLELAVSVK